MVIDYTPGMAIVLPLILIAVLLPFATSVIALGSEMAGQIQNKLADKFSQQISRLGCLVALAITLAGVALTVIFGPTGKGTEYVGGLSFLLFRLAPGLILGTGIFFIYLFSWKKLKRNKPAHASLGAMAAVLLGIFLFVFLQTSMSRTPLVNVQDLPAMDSVIYPLVLQWLIFALSAGGTIGLAFLLARRNRDDFGRDYYKYALGLSSKWALTGTILGFLPCIWTGWLLWPHLHLMPLVLPGTISVIAAAYICILAVVLMRASQPLRFKGMIILGQFFLWLFFAARILVHLEIMNMMPDMPDTHVFTAQWINILF